MSFEINFVVSAEKSLPSQEQMKEYISQLPNMTEIAEPPEGCEWQFEYLNEDTSVSFTFSYNVPEEDLIRGKVRDTGLLASIPTVCPTFVARECMPIIEQMTKISKMWVYTPTGEILQKCDASQMQIMWTDLNRTSVMHMGPGPGGVQPHYFPLEELNSMWHYQCSRPAMLKRYSAKKIYVPRVNIIRNKLSRKQVYRAAVWTDMAPSVIPDVDVFIMTKYKNLLFGRFPRGEGDLVVVKRELIEELMKPFMRAANRPIEHFLIEDTSKLKLPVWKVLQKSLPLRFQNFESINVEEIIDVKV
ncbi:MAG: hypothetical protein K6G50_08115 [bacterium]|nr:hypothetical protein [bacterium]